MRLSLVLLEVPLPLLLSLVCFLYSDSKKLSTCLMPTLIDPSIPPVPLWCCHLSLYSTLLASLNVSFNLLPAVFPASASFYPGISWPVWTLWLHLCCTSDLWCIPDTPHPGHSQRDAQHFHLYSLQFFLPSFLALANLFHTFPLPPLVRVLLAAPKHTQRTSPCTTCLDKRPVCFSLVLAAIVQVCRQQPAICELFIQLEWDLSVGHLWVISTLTVCLINYSLAFTCRCAAGDNDLWNSFLMKTTCRPLLKSSTAVCRFCDNMEKWTESALTSTPNLFIYFLQHLLQSWE